MLNSKNVFFSMVVVALLFGALLVLVDVADCKKDKIIINSGGGHGHSHHQFSKFSK